MWVFCHCLYAVQKLITCYVTLDLYLSVMTAKSVTVDYSVMHYFILYSSVECSLSGQECHFFDSLLTVLAIHDEHTEFTSKRWCLYLYVTLLSCDSSYQSLWERYSGRKKSCVCVA